MLLEQLWPGVTQALTADGDATGVLTVASTSGFYSGQLVQLKATGLATIDAKVLEVLSATTLRIGAPTQSYTGAGVSAAGYITGLSATLTAKSQPKVFPGNDETVAVVYEAQPTTALRVMTVDRQGAYVSGGTGSAASVSVTNTVSITTALIPASFQFVKTVAATITAGNAALASAFPAGTISGNARIFSCLNSLNSPVGISLNGVQITELEASNSFAFDLATNGKQINASTTVGVWNVSATSTTGSIRFTFVS